MAIQIRRREIYINAWQRGYSRYGRSGRQMLRLPPGKDNVHE